MNKVGPIVLDALIMLASLQERVSDRDVTLHKLRKLLGVVKPSEKLIGLLPSNIYQNNYVVMPAGFFCGASLTCQSRFW